MDPSGKDMHVSVGPTDAKMMLCVPEDTARWSAANTGGTGLVAGQQGSWLSVSQHSLVHQRFPRPYDG